MLLLIPNDGFPRRVNTIVLLLKLLVNMIQNNNIIIGKTTMMYIIETSNAVCAKTESVSGHIYYQPLPEKNISGRRPK